MSSINKFKWFWAWDDEKEEAWLREMALDGWHFQSVTFPGYYTFEKGDQRNDFHRLDFLSNTKDKENYLQLFEDAGWRHVGEYGSWQYFRKTATERETLEIFTDNDSKINKYTRVITFLVIFFPIYSIMLITLSKAEGLFYEIVTFVCFLLCGIVCLRDGDAVKKNRAVEEKVINRDFRVFQKLGSLHFRSRR